jgi:TldD protein
MKICEFDPFGKNLIYEDAVKSLKLATENSEDGELFFEQRQTETITFDDSRVKSANFDSSEGMGMRSVSGEITGYAHSTDLSFSALSKMIPTLQKASQEKKCLLAEAPIKTKKHLYDPSNPISELTFSKKIKILQEIDDFTRSLDPNIKQVTATISASNQKIFILRPDGSSYSDIRPMVRLNISILLESNGRRENGYTGTGGRDTLLSFLKPEVWKSAASEALRIAKVNLHATPAPAGIMDLVLGPGWPGILLHEAIGHGLEADFNRKKTSAFSELMGKRIAAPGVTVFDDGTIPNRRGSVTIDDEGTPSQKTKLIDDGVLVGYMHDRQNSRLMGLQSTGNGRRQSYAHAPMPRMTNTYMEAGNEKPKNLIRDLKDGLYAVGFGGGQVDITNGKFVFSCTEAYRVQNGEIKEAVNGATLIGDGASALQKIKAIGNDLQLDPGIGNCGKAGQWVPVGVGQPSLYISGLTVGGVSN